MNAEAIDVEATLSKLIDIALERLIVEELKRRHVAGSLTCRATRSARSS